MCYAVVLLMNETAPSVVLLINNHSVLLYNHRPARFFACGSSHIPLSLVFAHLEGNRHAHGQCGSRHGQLPISKSLL
jgi:hypothetical protein